MLSIPASERCQPSGCFGASEGEYSSKRVGQTVPETELLLHVMCLSTLRSKRVS